MKFTLPFIAAVVAFASQALASPAPQTTTTPATIICPFTTPSTTGPPQTVLQCDSGFFCCQILGNDAFCVTESFPGNQGCPRLPANPPSA
ncbi:hypothetical protein D9613_004010 [Agrocybe pediades]|uniref:Uncharacterized protein n=1 Tax=Agrocybe pediades TaxID=84607 RepID=A0A8H4VL65_9AGAR|nr:hypothetical protein D9613_004010 [Agrocybe pediades]